jgi:endonuclease/exonuclease/phosphatase family metal-dependent hydrolase
MKKTLTFLIISMIAFCAYAQDLYIGSYYVTSGTEESQYGDGNDKWTTRANVIRNMFNFENPDVIGLQSLTASESTQLDKFMTNHLLVNDILYHKDLQVDTCGVLEGLPEGSTCSWAKFQKEENAFYVFNMCLSSDQDAATESATFIRNATRDINSSNLPCFIVGYLGVDQTSRAYPKISILFNDCYTTADVVSAEYGTINNFDLEANHNNNRYDFVFASKKVIVKAYGQLQYGYFTKESDGSYKRRLPSTHFPVMVKATLR